MSEHKTIPCWYISMAIIPLRLLCSEVCCIRKEFEGRLISVHSLAADNPRSRDLAHSSWLSQDLLWGIAFCPQPYIGGGQVRPGDRAVAASYPPVSPTLRPYHGWSTINWSATARSLQWPDLHGFTAAVTGKLWFLSCHIRVDLALGRAGTSRRKRAEENGSPSFGIACSIY